MVEPAVGFHTEKLAVRGLNEIGRSDIRPVKAVQNRIGASCGIETKNRIEGLVLLTCDRRAVEISIRGGRERVGASAVRLLLSIEGVQDLVAAAWANAKYYVLGHVGRAGDAVEVTVEPLRDEGGKATICAG